MIRLTSCTSARHSVKVFADATRALEHLCDHLFTRREADFWAVFLTHHAHSLPQQDCEALNDLVGLLPPGDPERLFSFARSAWSVWKAWNEAGQQSAWPPAGHPSAALLTQMQTFYEGYSAAVIRAVAAADALGWWWEQCERPKDMWLTPAPAGTDAERAYWQQYRAEGGRYTRHNFGLNGVEVICGKRVVYTAFLRISARACRSRVQPETRLKNPLPRQREQEKTSRPLGVKDRVPYALFLKTADHVRRLQARRLKKMRKLIQQRRLDRVEVIVRGPFNLKTVPGPQHWEQAVQDVERIVAGTMTGSATTPLPPSPPPPATPAGPGGAP